VTLLPAKQAVLLAISSSIPDCGLRFLYGPSISRYKDFFISLLPLHVAPVIDAAALANLNKEIS
jgi:hypothetical protein